VKHGSISLQSHTWEAEAEEPRVPGKPKLYRETLLQRERGEREREREWRERGEREERERERRESGEGREERKKRKGKKLRKKKCPF
jgi:hypothetical protein